jgi:lipoyl-dependent peroxiredoxin
MTTKFDQILYTAHATATGGREGTARSSDGAFGSNPEQLFAAGYAACFIGALKFVAGQQKISLPANTKIDSSVAIGTIPNAFAIQVAMSIHIPGIELAQAQALVDAAHQVCPYSNATRGNVEVTLTVI